MAELEKSLENKEPAGLSCRRKRQTLRARTWARAPACTLQAKLGLNEAKIYIYMVFCVCFFASTNGGLNGCWNFLLPSQNTARKGRHRHLSQPGVSGQMTFRYLLAPSTYCFVIVHFLELL